MNILLIQVVNSEYKSYRTFSPPLGLLYLASSLLVHGHEVEVIDCEQEENYLEAIHKALLVYKANFIGFSTLTTNFKSVIEIARFVKSINPAVKVVLGGIHATYFPKRILRSYREVDFIVKGEGEETFSDLIVNHEHPERVPGIVYRKQGEIYDSGPRAKNMNLDDLPFPARHLVNKYSYSYQSDSYSLKDHFYKFITDGGNFASIVSSRGCPSQCRYCANSAFHNGLIRFRSAQNVLLEVEELIRSGYRKFVFVDDHFTSHSKRVKEICEGLADFRRQYNISWACMGRLETATDEVLRLMSGAGCNKLLIGLENGSQRILDYYNKRIDLEKARDAIRRANKYKIEIIASVILGAPGETFDDVKLTSNYLNTIDIDFLEVNKLTVFPGTPIWEELKGKEIINDEKDWEDVVFSHDIIPDLTVETLHAWSVYIKRRYYFRPRYIRRQVSRLFNKLLLSGG